jgi:hypothetical protein
MKTHARALPYLLSWSVLGLLIVVGMQRLPLALYTPIDGEWAKWNAEAILRFARVLDLSPYSMLAGMGSTYFPNLPWLNPGALALALPIEDSAKDIVSYAIYAAELAFSIVLLARVIGFSWLIATVGAQLYLYVLFPPFSEVFLTYTGNSFSLAPYYAHLIAVLNAALGAFLMCGRSRDWRHNPCAGRMRSRAVHFRSPLGAFHLHLFHASLSRDRCRADRDAAPLARRMGLEGGGACREPDLLFRVGSARLLSGHHRDRQPHAANRIRLG